MSREFWAGRRVLVTGADGFIGSHAAERLVQLGAEVRAFCFYNSNSSLGWLDESAQPVKESIDARFGDIRDGRIVEEACRGIDTVFHLAALVSIPFSYQAPESFVDTNVKGTLNVLEAARRNNCRRLVHTSTSEVYGTPGSLPIRETHPLKGQSPYSATKIAADKLCEAYFSSFGVPVTVLRPFNTYGPRQSTRAVLPTILVQLLAGKREVRLGSLTPKRDFTFVADTVEGLMKAGSANGVEGQVIHLGTGISLSVGELFQLAQTALGVKAEIVQEKLRVRPNASEVMVLQSDPAKAQQMLGWKALTPVTEGIRLTAVWLRERLNHYDPARFRA